jgi:hypothetical protein
MRIDGWPGETARRVRHGWSSVAATALAVMVIAFCPFPAEGHSILAGINRLGLDGELVEGVIRLVIWAAFRAMQGVARVGH